MNSQPSRARKRLVALLQEQQRLLADRARAAAAAERDAAAADIYLDRHADLLALADRFATLAPEFFRLGDFVAVHDTCRAALAIPKGLDLHDRDQVEVWRGAAFLAQHQAERARAVFASMSTHVPSLAARHAAAASLLEEVGLVDEARQAVAAAQELLRAHATPTEGQDVPSLDEGSPCR